MYGDLETYDVCWYAIVPMYNPWWEEGDFDDDEYEYEDRSKPYKRTVLVSFKSR